MTSDMTAKQGTPPERASAGALVSDRRGAIFVEFLIAFLPVFIFFLCLVQLGLLFAVRLVTEHAALNTARAASVVVGDDPARYDNESQLNQFTYKNSKRYDALRQAALLTLAPFILDGTIEEVTLQFPDSNTPGGDGRTGTIQYAAMTPSSVTKVRVRVEVEAACKIAIANRFVCRSLWNLVGKTPVAPFPTKTVRAEAVFPYQGASYEYP